MINPGDVKAQFEFTDSYNWSQYQGGTSHSTLDGYFKVETNPISWTKDGVWPATDWYSDVPVVYTETDNGSTSTYTNNSSLNVHAQADFSFHNQPWAEEDKEGGFRATYSAFTGGKSVAGRCSFLAFGITLTGIAIEQDSTLYSVKSVYTGDLPGDQTTVSSFGTADSRGSLYITIPDGEMIDVTPTTTAASSFDASIGFVKYVPHLHVNFDDLESGNIKALVGQKLNLNVNWYTYGDDGSYGAYGIYGSESHLWLPGSTFVNKIVSANGNVSPQYLLDLTLLTNSGPDIWYCNSGKKTISCMVTIRSITGGSSATGRVSKTLTVVAPTINSLTQDSSPPGVNFFIDGPFQELGFCDTNGNGMQWTIGITGVNGFNGKAWHTQLIRRDTSYDTMLISYSTSTHGDYWLDTADPYSDQKVVFETGKNEYRELRFADGPDIYRDSGFYNYVEMNDSFKTYVRFQPDSGNSIPVTLGRIDWGWHGRAERGTNGGWSLTVSNWYGPTPNWKDTQPVMWTNVYTGSN